MTCSVHFLDIASIFHSLKLNSVLFTLLCITDNCQVPILNSPVKVEMITNSSVQLQGSELSLHCKEGFVPTKPHLETTVLVCSSNGTWIPDPHDYDCQQNNNMTKEGTCMYMPYEWYTIILVMHNNYIKYQKHSYSINIMLYRVISTK